MSAGPRRLADPGWTTILSPEAVADILARPGDSATAFWWARSDDELRSEMRSAHRSNAPVRHEIARSLLAARAAVQPAPEQPGNADQSDSIDRSRPDLSPQRES